MSFSNGGNVTSTGDGTPFRFHPRQRQSFGLQHSRCHRDEHADQQHFHREQGHDLPVRALNVIGIYNARIGRAEHDEDREPPVASLGDLAAFMVDGPALPTILNSGDISSGSQLALGVYGGGATVINTGHITGYLMLDADDSFINLK